MSFAVALKEIGMVKKLDLIAGFTIGSPNTHASGSVLFTIYIIL